MEDGIDNILAQFRFFFYNFEIYNFNPQTRPGLALLQNQCPQNVLLP